MDQEQILELNEADLLHLEGRKGIGCPTPTMTGMTPWTFGTAARHPLRHGHQRDDIVKFNGLRVFSSAVKSGGSVMHRRPRRQDALSNVRSSPAATCSRSGQCRWPPSSRRDGGRSTPSAPSKTTSARPSRSCRRPGQPVACCRRRYATVNRPSTGCAVPAKLGRSRPTATTTCGTALVVDFPMFEFNSDENRAPCTTPSPQHRRSQQTCIEVGFLFRAPAQASTWCSERQARWRLPRPRLRLQRQVLQTWPPSKAQEQFGCDGRPRVGAPPHGGARCGPHGDAVAARNRPRHHRPKTSSALHDNAPGKCGRQQLGERMWPAPGSSPIGGLTSQRGWQSRESAHLCTRSTANPEVGLQGQLCPASPDGPGDP